MIEPAQVSWIDWPRAVAKVMAASTELQTQQALARESGVAQSTIGRILRGRVTPQVDNLERIAAAFKMSFAKLVEISQEGVPPPEPTDELRALARSTRVPLISWVQAGSFVDALDNPPLSDREEWMPRPKHSGARTFALRVRGESMEPIYQHGDIIFVDRDVVPEHGSDVVARIGDRGEVVFKRLVLEGESERPYLKPVNPNWPTRIIEISADSAAQLVGVVIGKWVASSRALRPHTND